MRDVGYCECGCGGLAPIAPKNDTKRGYVKGKPRRFIAGHAIRRDPAERFWEKVDKGAPDECWQWAGTSHPSGYGMFMVEKLGVGRQDRRYAHRYAYEIIVGPIPEGLEVDHLCFNRGCVNPAHLEAVTHTENVRRSSTAKITQQDAAAIRSSSEPRGVLAARYGIVKRYVDAIRRGEYWG